MSSADGVLRSPVMSRRSLLIGGSALAVASTAIGRLVLGGSGAGEGTLGTLAGRGPQISIGFVDVVAEPGAPFLAGRPRVVPAGGVRAGGLGQTAQVRVAGATPRVGAEGPPVSIHLDALYPNPDGGDPLRHMAWTMSGGSVSPPTRFSAPVGAMSVGFALGSAAETSTGAVHAGTSVMTAGAEEGLPRLRPGTYLLALGEGTWDTAGRVPAADDPAWDDLGSVALTVTPA